VSTELDLDGGIRRYPADTYFGGGAWPVLTASLGWYLASIGELDEARRRLQWIAEKFDVEGRLGEQFGGEGRDRGKYDEWVGRWGLPARDLAWSHAMFVVLCDELDPALRTATVDLDSPVC
jgi:GH15 family glucan-1,4-alpha-glucosidase